MEATTEVEVRKSRKRRGQRGMGNIYEHRRSWWLDVRANGARHRLKLGPCKVLEKREARKIADERIRQLLMPKPPAAKGDIQFGTFAKRFTDHYMQTRKSWAKCAGKAPERTPFQHCVRFFGDKLLKDITPVDVEDFRSFLLTRKVGKERHMKMASANRNVSLLRAAFYWAMRNGLAARNPVAELPRGEKMKNEAAVATRVLEREEQPAVLELLPDWLRLLVIFCLQTAARRGDLLKLTWRAVHTDHVEFLDTKESKMRCITLSENARMILAILRPSPAAEDAFVFEPKVPRKTMESRIRREWNRAVKKAAVPRIRFHDLRHTALTRMVVNGEDLRTVKDIAGHRSLSTTQRYLHSNDKLKRQAVEKLSEFGRYLPSAPETSLAETPVSGRIN